MAKPSIHFYNKGKTKEYYSIVGEDFINSKNKLKSDKYFESLIPKNLKNKTVLDLGCGNARFSELLCQRNAKKVIGVDISAEMAKQARARKKEKKLKNFTVIQKDFNNLQIKKDSIDFIFLRYSLEQITDIEKTINKIASYLKKKGQILIITNFYKILNEAESEKIKKLPVPVILTIGNKKIRIINTIKTEQECKQYFKQAGLKIIAEKKFPCKNVIPSKKYKYINDLKITTFILKLSKQ